MVEPVFAGSNVRTWRSFGCPNIFKGGRSGSWGADAPPANFEFWTELRLVPWGADGPPVILKVCTKMLSSLVLEVLNGGRSTPRAWTVRESSNGQLYHTIFADLGDGFEQRTVRS